MPELTEEKVVFKRPDTIKKDYEYTFCPGCGHGIVLRLIAECIDELNVQKDTIAVASVGSSISLEKYFDLHVVASSHGRAPTTLLHSPPEMLGTFKSANNSSAAR